MKQEINTSKHDFSFLRKLLSCNLQNNNFENFSEEDYVEEKNIYLEATKDWSNYDVVSSLEGWKHPVHVYPNLNKHHGEILESLRYLNFPERVCEIGAGAGEVSKYVYNFYNLEKKNLLLTCLEGSKIHVEQMRQNFDDTKSIIEPLVCVKANIVNDFIQNEPFKNEEFDVIYTCTVMMHIPFLMIPKAAIEIVRSTSKYIIHVENKNDKINGVVMANQKSSLNKLSIDYQKLYSCLDVKTILYKEYPDPSNDCSYVVYIGEKIKK